MNENYRRLLDALRCALHDEQVQWSEPLLQENQLEMFRLASEHSVLPLYAEAVFPCLPKVYDERPRDLLVRAARRYTVAQAQRTADFLLFYRFLAKRGLEPIVLKGLVCRSVYPHPNQRASVDEDLLVLKEEMALYHQAMLDYGLAPFGEIESIDDATETAYKSADGVLYVEVHASPFPIESKAYGDCNAPFEGAAERSIRMTIEGTQIRTLEPTDHLLYLVVHAYKHFLHGGFGIRQVCDVGMFANRYAYSVDWDRFVRECESLHLLKFTAAIMRICEKYLGFHAQKDFSGIEIDEEPLLNDIMSGGLYGVKDINRAHSSTMTLDAVAADRQGRRSSGALHSVFLPARDLAGRYKYLRKHKFLLPVAWIQRGFSYITDRSAGRKKPSVSVRIGKDRVALLKQYGIIG